MLKSLFAILLIGVELGGTSQSPAVFNIEAEGRPGSHVFLIAEKDPVSGLRTIPAQGITDSHGEATLTVPLTETGKVWIECGHVAYPLYAQPGGIYDLLLPAPDALVPLTFARSGRMAPVFKSIDHGDLNMLIAELNRMYDQFFEAHYMDFAYEHLRGNNDYLRNEGENLRHLNLISDHPEAVLVPPARTDWLLDSLSLAMLAAFSTTGNDPFFRTYLEMTLADLDRMKKMPDEEIFNKYFADRPLAIGNPSWWHMFEWFNRDFIIRWSNLNLEFKATLAAGDIKGASEALTQVPCFADADFRMLSLTLGLARSSTIHINTAIIMLRQLTSMASPDVKAVLEAAVQRGQRGTVGLPAPGFTAVNAQGNFVKLSDFAGQHVYIQFFASWCTTCLAEMREISQYAKAYGKHITFLCISMDKDESHFKEFIQKNRHMTQTFLYGGLSPLQAEEWALVTLPRYVLLDPEGKILKFEASSPIRGIEPELERISTKAASKPKGGSWND